MMRNNCLSEYQNIKKRKEAEEIMNQETDKTIERDGVRYLQRNGVDYEMVDSKKYVKNRLEQGSETIYAVKDANVIARMATKDEDVTVYTADGNTEVKNEHAKAGQMILIRADLDGKPVLNDNGHSNSWVTDKKTFEKKYDIPEGTDFSDGSSSVYKPKGGVQKFMQTDKDIAIEVSWGENGKPIPLTVKKGGVLNVTNTDDIYGIAKEEFGKTYCRTDEKGTPVSSPNKRTSQRFARGIAGMQSSVSSSGLDKDIDGPDR